MPTIFTLEFSNLELTVYHESFNEMLFQLLLYLQSPEIPTNQNKIAINWSPALFLILVSFLTPSSIIKTTLNKKTKNGSKSINTVIQSYVLCISRKSKKRGVKLIRERERRGEWGREEHLCLLTSCAFSLFF